MKLLTRWAAPLAATALIVGLLVGMAGLASAVPPPTSVSSGAATVSGVTVNGSGNNYALVSSTAHVVVAGNYAVNDTGCTGCIDEIQIGWAGTAAPVACIYTGGSIGNGSFSQDLGPAPNAGVDEVIINFAQAAGCSLGTWSSSNAGPAIAEVAVSPPNSGSKGNASVSGVTINGGPGNSAITPAGSSVTVAGNYLMNAGCVGCGQQIQIGWAGSSAQFGCIYADGPHGSGTFTFNMLMPPSLGANYVVINATQNSGNIYGGMVEFRTRDRLGLCLATTTSDSHQRDPRCGTDAGRNIGDRQGHQFVCQRHQFRDQCRHRGELLDYLLLHRYRPGRDGGHRGRDGDHSRRHLGHQWG